MLSPCLFSKLNFSHSKDDFFFFLSKIVSIFFVLQPYLTVGNLSKLGILP